MAKMESKPTPVSSKGTFHSFGLEGRNLSKAEFLKEDKAGKQAYTSLIKGNVSQLWIRRQES